MAILTILLHVIILLAFAVLFKVLGIAKAKRTKSYLTAFGYIGIVLLVELVAEIGFTAISGAIIQMTTNGARYVLVAAEVIVVLAFFLGSVGIVKKMQCGEIPGFVYGLAAVSVFLTILIAMRSFNEAADLIARWDIMGKEEYMMRTGYIDRLDLYLLLIGLLPSVVLDIFTLVDGILSKKKQA